ncbi:alpha/beta fold hydrolase [Actinoplanes sp. CA-142083]|uniref:alpha/beta fold hydrolase n=1 Tax=Actinoplanes sp. CA-142083 TaxID=3239903 RepID=UPI003D8FD045
MTDPVVVLVHGAFAESASWNGVIERLAERGVRAVAVANPLRSLDGDAAYVRDVVASIGGPVVLAGHSYGGQVITQAAAGNDAVKALVYVSAFAPDQGESALALTGKFPGSTLGDAVLSKPLTAGGTELAIDVPKFALQFAADADPATAALMAATQRPVAEVALTAGLDGEPAWRTVRSWHVWGAADKNIPAEAMRFMAERAGAEQAQEIPGGSHALTVSQPGQVADLIHAALESVK